MSNPGTGHFEHQMAERSAFVRDWCTAFHRYRAEHSGQFPSSFAEAWPYFKAQSEHRLELSTGDFEIVYRGLWNTVGRPNAVILLKEREAWKSPDGRWAKVYGMAEGSAVGLTRDKVVAFEQWEQERTA